jgi:hypothetical protein
LIAVTRKQIVVVALIVLVASSLSALVAYRRAIRQSGLRDGAAGVVRAGGSGGCLDFHDAGSHTGETGCVSGRVLRVFVSRGGNVFLDFCADYRKCPFTSVIFSSDRGKFGDLSTLGGRDVEIQGFITVYQGRAEVVIHDAQQIRVSP